MKSTEARSYLNRRYPVLQVRVYVIGKDVPPENASSTRVCLFVDDDDVVRRIPRCG